jgi:Flp pilus assembly protein TadD
MQAIYGRRTTEAISALRERLAEKPDDVQARNELGRMLLISGDRAGAIQAYDALVAISDVPAPIRSVALYNLACAHALEGHRDAALGRLEEAAAAGFTNASQISADPDLETLRQEPRYHALVERLGAARTGDARR